MSWLEELETRLEQELEAFLASNPAQDALMRDQEAREHQARLIGRRRQLQQDAQQRRDHLLELAQEIRQWRQRAERARGAGALELAGRAEAHGESLMRQGRQRWQELQQLGQAFNQVEKELQELKPQAKPPPRQPGGDVAELERAWASLELEQELERLRGQQR